ncbi:probable serine/threonine-protein kinase At1g01540 [Rutidosis leptorrhynchoides]|uniref:probable serine/threonine-protein kinase At1g01540 n=1 Tax=Rutidosis leptorrhynchoides TaxID=125765 RepID=UPI003A9A2E85
MSIYDAAFINAELSKRTSIFGLRLWVVIGILLGSVIVIALFLLSLCLTSRRKNHGVAKPQSNAVPVSKEIQEIVTHHQQQPHAAAAAPVADIQVDIGKIEHRVVYSDKLPPLISSSGNTVSGESRGTVWSETASFGGGSGSVGPEVSHLGWGRWYTLRELEEATGAFVDENVIGEGGYGIVYHGVLSDGTRVAVKNLLNNRGQAEREFKAEVEVIGRVRHKNLVRLLGYCVEGAHRMLVYEYVDNGNLEQWLHGDVGDVSPLTWEIRMNIILGTAKGLAYLHEGLEPKVVHRDVKSSNILLDRLWQPKVSDFSLAKLLCSERSYVTTRVMGTFGYVAPEYACTGMLTDKSDVYSLGVLIMEIITGRNPVDYSRPKGEVNLVEWLKTMVGDRRSEEVVDPKMPQMPSPKPLKRLLLVALRCVDPDATKRPKMGHVLHMLEADEFLYRDGQRSGKESSHSRHNNGKSDGAPKLVEKQWGEGTSTEGDIDRNNDHLARWR